VVLVGVILETAIKRITDGSDTALDEMMLRAA
jgi:hypothetical protein